MPIPRFAATFILGSLSCCTAAAGDVHFVIYVDEMVGQGHAFYIAEDQSGGTANCPKNPDGFGFRCSLDYHLDKGVPTVFYQPGPKGQVGREVTLGEVLLTEELPEFHNDVRSDLLRFVNGGHGLNGGADRLEFYSLPDDTDPSGITDLTLPPLDPNSKTCNSQDLNPLRNPQCQELDLGTLGTAGNPPKPTLRGGNGNNDVFGKRLDGLMGYYYVAGFNVDPTGKKVIDPGDFAVTSEGPVGYVFVSGADILSSISKQSVHFASATSTLQFTNDTVTDTGSAGDPLVGADVNAPTFLLQGTTPDGQELFTPLNGGQFTLGSGPCTYLRATVSALTYSPSQNQFKATLSSVFVAGVDATSPLYDPTLGCIDSSFLQYVDNILDPNSLLFDDQASLFLTYQPDTDFFAQSSAFTADAESSFTNTVAIGQIPEPRATVPLGVALLGMLLWVKERL